MSRPNHSRTCRKDLKRSCRGVVRRRSSRPAWRIVLRRARQNIDSAARLIDGGFASLDVLETCPFGRRLIGVARNLVGLPRLLDQAHENLARAARRLGEANETLARDPRSIEQAPAAMMRQTARLLETGMRLERLSNKAGVKLARMARALEMTAADLAAANADAPDAGAELPDERANVEIPKPDWRRTFLRHRHWRMSDRLRSLRRRRRSPLRAADAPRRVSRGRAPPSLPICQPGL